MTHRIAIVLSALPVWFLAAALFSASPTRACGFTEAPVDCGDSAESEARYMLNRVVAAVGKDKAKALDEFSRGEEGFRTVDSYVFCIGPDGVMTAHPSAMLRGQDVRALHDETGNYFIATMLKTAEAGKVAQIRYLFPRPGATTASAKTTWYTRAGDQVCAVGVYDDGDAPSAPQTLDARLAMLRQRLAAGMPASLATDWTAYQQALDEQSATRTTAIAKAREQIRAADSALTVDAMSAAASR